MTIGTWENQPENPIGKIIGGLAGLVNVDRKRTGKIHHAMNG